jgi:hypothetical protein
MASATAASDETHLLTMMGQGQEWTERRNAKTVWLGPVVVAAEWAMAAANCESTPNHCRNTRLIKHSKSEIKSNPSTTR